MSDSSYEILCTSCRTPIPSASKICPACGHSLHRGDVSSLLLDTSPRPPVQAAAATVPPLVIPALRADGTRRYAGFWIRVAAVFVDSLVLGIPYFLLTRTFGRYGEAAAVLAAWLYFPLMESSASQGTIGKIAFSLTVTDTSFRRISLKRAVGRQFAKILSTLTLDLGYVMVGLTSQKRGLHDFVAGTLVLRA
jgi:uncharacterized RDD family membrane protein YckC